LAFEADNMWRKRGFEMILRVTAALLIFIVAGAPIALCQNLNLPLSHLPQSMVEKGSPFTGTLPAAIANFRPNELLQAASELPTAQLSDIARQRFTETSARRTRSAKDADIYRSISPSVVLILTKDGVLGSGSLIDTSGHILTNAHVVGDNAYVAVVFKPSIEGKEWTRDDMKSARVISRDKTSDLALIKVDDPPKGKNPIRLGDTADISVGLDVHAIGHPKGETWTYTKGVISQYRLGFEWEDDGGHFKHRADVVQTQTPINTGNSGGPLISDGGALIGVNSFKSATGEGLSFAVAVDEVKKFLARSGSQQQTDSSPKKPNCEAREVSRTRDKKGETTIIAYDLSCSGRVNANYIIPDKTSDAIVLTIDRNGDGKPDVMYFDFKRVGKWDLSFWDEKFEGRWTLVGFHSDGGLEPSSFESYDIFEKRMAKR
jgi:S1-C subfamily serine protease